MKEELINYFEGMGFKVKSNGNIISARDKMFEIDIVLKPDGVFGYDETCYGNGLEVILALKEADNAKNSVESIKEHIDTFYKALTRLKNENAR